MKTKTKLLLLMGMLFLCCIISTIAEPTSTIEVQDSKSYVPYQSDDFVGLSTSETPTPECPGDSANGDPDYFWDGGALDLDDNGDGTAIVESDISGSVGVTVYCEQEFTSPDGTYTEDTNLSAPQVVTIQIPSLISFISGAGGADIGPTYVFKLQDQSSDHNPMANVSITAHESVSGISGTYKNAYGVTVYSGFSYIPGTEAFIGMTGSTGSYYDFVQSAYAMLESFARASGNGGQCTVTNVPYSHSYSGIQYLGVEYSTNTISQTQNWTVTCTINSSNDAVFSTTDVSPTSP